MKNRPYLLYFVQRTKAPTATAFTSASYSTFAYLKGKPEGGDLGAPGCGGGAGAEGLVAASSAVGSGLTAVAVLGAAVAKGRSLAGCLGGTTARAVDGNLGGSGSRSGGLGGGGSRLSRGSSRLSRGGSTVATAVTEGRVAAGSAVVSRRAAVAVLGAAVTEGGSEAGPAKRVSIDMAVRRVKTYCPAVPAQLPSVETLPPVAGAVEGVGSVVPEPAPAPVALRYQLALSSPRHSPTVTALYPSWVMVESIKSVRL
jgi:hypothetical protein